MPFKSEKQRKWMHANEPEMAKKWEKEESIDEANASVIRKKLLKQFGDDPLYKDFIIAKTSKEQKKALKTLKSIRGFNAVRLMQKYVKKLQDESIKGKLRNLIKQEIKSINERKLSSHQKKAILIAIEMSGNMTGATKKIERIKRGLSNDKKVKDALRLANESINESDLGLTYKKGKTVKVTHKKSGKELVIIDKPNVKREYEKIGYFAEGKINEGFDKYYLSSLLDSKLKKKLEIAIKNLKGQVDGVGDDWIWFRMPSGNIRTLAQLIQRLDRNKNVWIGDKRKKSIWDRRQKINKLEATTTSAVPPYDTPMAFSKSTQKAIDVDDEDDEDEILGGQRKESYKVNIDKLLQNSKIKKLMKRLGIRKSQSQQGAIQLLNYFANNPYALAAFKKLAVGESMAAPFRRRNSRGLGRPMKVGLNESAVSFWQDMFRPGPIPKKYINQLIKKKGELPSKKHIKRIYRDNGNPSSRELAKTWKDLTKEKYVRAASGMWRWNADFTGWESIDESGILYRAGVKKYGKEGMKKIQQAAGKRKSHAEIGKIKDKYEKDKKESINEDAKPKRGDYVKTIFGIAQIEKIRGTVAFMKLPGKKTKGYWLNDLKNLKSTDRDEKGKTLWTESIDELTMAPFSSQEARLHIDADIKKMSKELGKISQGIIKIMMDGVKRGKYTAMDIQRGLKEGPAQRTHFGELTFIRSLWSKMREKFRKYSKHGKLS